jgi:hypothetical protein
VKLDVGCHIQYFSSMGRRRRATVTKLPSINPIDMIDVKPVTHEAANAPFGSGKVICEARIFRVSMSR